jgi:hypothetical protein
MFQVEYDYFSSGNVGSLLKFTEIQNLHAELKKESAFSWK